MMNKKAWGEQHQLFKGIVLKPERFDEAIGLGLELHAMVHLSEMSLIKEATFEDELWEVLDEKTFRCKPTLKDVTIAWNLWHLTRIEDITMNILVASQAQVMNTERLKKMNVQVVDTGNAMTDEEIIDFSSRINMQELRNYRIAVGRKTREIISGFRISAIRFEEEDEQSGKSRTDI
jgi:oligoribonuclease NrnB/cAMP/cGMP phosphodiesterase (DHH superfamily)